MGGKRGAEVAAGLESVEEGLMRVVDVAQFLGVSRSKVYQLLDSGELRSVRIGASRRVPRRVLLDFARQRLESEVRGEVME